MEPNDILIRFTKDESGKITKAVELGVNDDSMLLEMQRVSEFLIRCLAVYDKGAAEVEFNEQLAFADKLAQSSPRILLPH